MLEENVPGLDDETKKYIDEHLHETDESRQKALAEIRRWLKEESPNLNARVETKYLLPFLRGCKFDIEKTKEKLTNYYTMRRDEVAWFQNRNPLLDELQELVKLGVFVPLKKTSNHKLVVIIRTAAHNPKKHSIDNVFKVGKMILDVAAMENEMSQIYGIAAVFDMEGISFGHASQLGPNVVKRAIFAWHNYHCSPKQLDFVRAPSYINVVLNIFKSFMSQKMKDRVRVHFGSVETLHDIIDKSILPVEYGGDGESMESLSSYWVEKLIHYKDWFEEDEKYKAE